MNPIKLLACIAAALLLQTQAHAASTNIYKWKDKDGVIHFSQTAPQGQEVEILSKKTPRAPLPDESATPAMDNPAMTVNADDAEPADTAKKKNEAPLVQKDQATCDKALKAIDDLQKPVIMNQGKIMSIEEKNAQIQRMQEIVNVHCP